MMCTPGAYNTHLTFYTSLQVDVVLTTGVPSKAIQDRENTRNAAAQQQQQHYTGEEGNFNNDKGNLGDKECLKYDVDRSLGGSSTLIQATGNLSCYSCPHHTHSLALTCGTTTPLLM